MRTGPFRKASPRASLVTLPQRNSAVKSISDKSGAAANLPCASLTGNAADPGPLDPLMQWDTEQKCAICGHVRSDPKYLKPGFAGVLRHECPRTVLGARRAAETRLEEPNTHAMPFSTRLECGFAMMNGGY